MIRNSLQQYVHEESITVKCDRCEYELDALLSNNDQMDRFKKTQII